MSAPTPRLAPHRVLFVLAYVAIAALVLFARPFGTAGAGDAPAVETAQTEVR